MSDQTIDLEAVKQVQQKIWSEGDFAIVAGTINIVGEDLCEAVDILPDERVLTPAAAATRRCRGTEGVGKHGRTRLRARAPRQGPGARGGGPARYRVRRRRRG